jgi:hypothetical protein
VVEMQGVRIAAVDAAARVAFGVVVVVVVVVLQGSRHRCRNAPLSQRAAGSGAAYRIRSRGRGAATASVASRVVTSWTRCDGGESRFSAFPLPWVVSRTSRLAADVTIGSLLIA